MTTMKNLWIAPLLAAALLTACNNEMAGPRVRGTGPTETETRTLNDFSQVALLIDAEVVLTQGSPQQVRVEAQRNVLNVLKTQLTGDELQLKFSRANVVDHTPIKVYLTLPTLTQVQVTGSGHIRSATPFTAASCEVQVSGSGRAELAFAQVAGLRTTVSGSGDVHLSGAAQSHDIRLSGSGEVDAYNLTAQNTDVSLSGSGRCYVRTARTLNANISGSGSVHYKGQPTVSTRISGSGRVLADN